MRRNTSTCSASSLGGAVALEVARRHPRLVRRLVLVDAATAPIERAIDPLAASVPFAPANFAEVRRRSRQA